MYKIKWVNNKNGKSGYYMTDKGVKTYKKLSDAVKAIEKFNKSKPAEIEYFVDYKLPGSK